jgi:pimeloyl-ACP methyl ester carboxylesterase
MRDMTFTSTTVTTDRLTTNVWTSGPDDGVPLLLVHGNLVTGGWWRYVAELLPDDVRVIAPDMRGFGRSQVKPVDATRGLDDMVDDVRALLAELGLADRGTVNAAGWSMGGGIVWRYAVAYPGDLASLTLVAPLSPYGFGGTKGPDGEPSTSDYAGSGGGGVNPDFVRRLREGDASADHPRTSPRVIMQQYFGPRDNAANVDEDFLFTETLRTAVSEDNYPGDATTSPNWPMVGPGTRGVLNAMSGKYYHAADVVALERKPPITWVLGPLDQVISDESLFDLPYLGKLGAVPDYPGEEALPAQPMVQQTRHVLDGYRAAGGEVEEVVVDGAAHGLPVETPDRVAAAITQRLVRP